VVGVRINKVILRVGMVVPLVVQIIRVTVCLAAPPQEWVLKMVDSILVRIMVVG
jgi:hypothetical protein